MVCFMRGYKSLLSTGQMSENTHWSHEKYLLSDTREYFSTKTSDATEYHFVLKPKHAKMAENTVLF